MQTKNTSIVYNNNWALLTIERPEKLNALNIETIQELNEVFKSLDENKAIRAIVLTGSGTKAFVAGADISEFAHFDKEEGIKLAAEGQRLLFDFVENELLNHRLKKYCFCYIHNHHKYQISYLIF